MIDCEKPGDCAYPGCDCPEDDDPFEEEEAPGLRYHGAVSFASRLYPGRSARRVSLHHAAG
jgi:hypothetical protein